MRLLPASVVVLCCVAFGVLPNASAQLIRVSADGSLEHIENEHLAPHFLPGTVEVMFEFELPDLVDVTPLIDEETVVYAAKSALLTFEQLQVPLHGAMFEVSRGWEESQEWTSYLLTGETSDGWRFYLQNVFATPAEDGAMFPVVSPGDLIVHAITLADEATGWAAFGDGVVREVAMQPVPEPATFALSGAMLAAGLIVVRSARRRASRIIE